MNKKLKKELEGFTLFEKCLAWLVVAVLMVGMVALSYGITTAIFYGVCWAFGFTFSFKTAFGLWLGICLFNIAFNGLGKKE